jgi:hypothetical protein
MASRERGENSYHEDYVENEDVNEWIESEEEEEEPAAAGSRYASLEEKYTESQLQIVRTSMDLSLHSLKGSLADASYIKMSPDYQRRARWDQKKRSQLIESFLMNVPVPPIFLYENRYNEYEVMDGRQRLEAVWDFLNNRFKLSGLEFWLELTGMAFNDLPPTLQRGLLRRTLTAIVLLAETKQRTESDVDVRLVLFRRLNTGGIKLNPQELRNALYPGLFSQMLQKVARTDMFSRLWGIPQVTPDEAAEPSSRLIKNPLYRSMADCELVLRFFAIRETVAGQWKGALRRILDRCMKHHMQDTPDQVALAEEMFLTSLRRVDQALPGNPFKLPETGRLSRPLYDALTVAMSYCPNVDPVAESEEITARFSSALADRQSYDVLIGRGNSVEAIQERVSLAKRIITGE